MHSLFRRAYTYLAPCPYVPLSAYSWQSYDPTAPPECGTLSWNPVVFSLFAAFYAGTYLLGLELMVQLFVQFRKRSLYFWSILVTSWGSMLFTTFSLVLQYVPNSATYGTVLLNLAWVAMVTGFAFVLYSRLKLLHPRPMMMRVILACILVNALLFHVPVVATTILSNVHYTNTTWKAYEITSYTEIAFTLQETVITTIYIWLFLRETKDRRNEPSTKRTLLQLFFAEFVVFSTDIILNVLLYTEYYLARAMIQSFASVLKLKIEFAVLNSLRKYSRSKEREQVNLQWLDPENGTVGGTPRTAQTLFEVPKL